LPGIGRAMIKPRFAARTDASPCRPCCSNAHRACLRCAGHCGTALATCSAGQTIAARLYAPPLVRTNKAVERKHVHTHARVGHAVSHKLKRATCTETDAKHPLLRPWRLSHTALRMRRPTAAAFGFNRRRDRFSE
jgi:hypothetical protein